MSRLASTILYENFYPWEIQLTAHMAWALKLLTLILVYIIYCKSSKFILAWVSIDIKYCTFGINLFRSTCSAGFTHNGSSGTFACVNVEILVKYSLDRLARLSNDHGQRAHAPRCYPFKF